ncbi:HIT family protein [Streptomyces carpinensis]|uniref:HIT family protein n=1 Tax=Streptomyces carpinensis TaxID=66369 RepID=A0ABV1W6Q1_9ACTN|nr:HIT family protein [Streptomyces carpinensis]
MPTLFTKIINGDLPGRFVWTDDRAVAFLTIAPVTPGHTLVVPREEVDDWTTIAPDLMSHLTTVSSKIGAAVRRAFDAPRAGLVVAGFEVPHCHLHVFPAWGLDDFDFRRANSNASAAELDEAHERILAALS